jgi:DNA-binding NarL/FixJ family response regulator
MPRLCKELFPLICQGKQNKEIASMYGKAESTINNRVQDLEVAYGARNRCGLIVNALVRGDITVDDLRAWVKKL